MVRPPGALLPHPDPQRRSQLEPLGVVGEGGAADQLRLELGKLALRQLGVALVEPLGRDQPEHRVAQELQPLVVLRHPLLVGEGAVGQGELQQVQPLEAVPEALLEGGGGPAAEEPWKACYPKGQRRPKRRSRSESVICRTIGRPCGQA